TQEQIRSDPAMRRGGKPTSKNNISKIEKAALAKLGTAADTIERELGLREKESNKQDRKEAAATDVETAKGMTNAVNTEVAKKLKSREDKRLAKLDAIAGKLIEELEKAKATGASEQELQQIRTEHERLFNDYQKRAPKPGKKLAPATEAAVPQAGPDSA